MPSPRRPTKSQIRKKIARKKICCKTFQSDTYITELCKLVCNIYFVHDCNLKMNLCLDEYDQIKKTPPPPKKQADK